MTQTWTIEKLSDGLTIKIKEANSGTLYYVPVGTLQYTKNINDLSNNSFILDGVTNSLLLKIDARTVTFPVYTGNIETFLVTLSELTAPSIGAGSGGGGTASWGAITGILSAQTDLQTALNTKQATLVSGTNVKTINGNSILGSTDIIIATPIIGLSIDGQGSTIQAASSAGFSVVQNTGTIQSWTIVGDISGSIVIDIKRNGVSIVGAGNKPTVTTSTNATAAATGWTSVAVIAGDFIEYQIISSSNFTRANLSIKLV